MAEKYIQIKLHGGGGFVVPPGKVGEAIAAELEDIQIGDTMTFDFQLVELEAEIYENLMEFEGH